MTGTQALGWLADRGVQVRTGATPGKVHARGDLTPEVRAFVDEHRAVLLALLWRVEAMRPLVTTGQPLPLLTARLTVSGDADRCLSCDEPSVSVRCPACVEAAHVVAAEAPRPVIRGGWPPGAQYAAH